MLKARDRTKKDVEISSAVKNDNINEVKHLIGDLQLVDKPDENGNYLVHHATRLPTTNMIAFLLESGVNIDQKNMIDNSFGALSPLADAARRNNLQMANYLIKCGASVNLGKNLIDRPLSQAALYNHFDMVKLLVESGSSLKKVLVFTGVGKVYRYLKEQGANGGIATIYFVGK